MDASISSNVYDPIAMALGTQSVNLEQMTVDQRCQLISRVIERCYPLKYFPGFCSLTEVVNYREKGVLHETGPGVMVVTQPMTKLFFLARLSNEAEDLAQGKKRVKRLTLFLDVEGRFVLWEEIFIREETLGDKLLEKAESSHFSLVRLSGQTLKEYLEHSYFTLGIVRQLTRAAQEDVPRREQRLLRAREMNQALQGVLDRLVVGNPDLDDDIPI